MKRLPLYIITLFIVCTAMAQTNNNKAQLKALAGRYGGNDGICLFEDGTYFIYGYATIIFGNYTVNNNTLHFTPDKPETFTVFASHNKNIGNKKRVHFLGFEEGHTFVRFNQDSLQKVFNQEANCFNYPYVYETEKDINRLTLVYKTKNNGEDTVNSYAQQVFDTGTGNNDFIVMFNEPHLYYEPFSASLSKVDGIYYLSPNANFGDRKIAQQKIGSQEQEDWKEILDMRKNYYFEKEVVQEHIFANKHYKLFYNASPEAYTFDASMNLYIGSWITEKENVYHTHDYNDLSALLKYNRVKAGEFTILKTLPASIAAGQVFYSSCNPVFPVYKYKDLHDPE